MNLATKHFNDRIHKWEHNIGVTSHNLVHNEAFWAAVIISLILISMILLAVFTHNAGTAPRSIYPTPFGPYPYY
ncbi:MAG: hypothetical protein A2Y12_13625 [Planctomycetes bacterium GWF2_42_9]|nr:MAG: hypothetical protein A2Y12_13625 [Planctomycetes bacterium GWF2_42_9]